MFSWSSEQEEQGIPPNRAEELEALIKHARDYLECTSHAGFTDLQHLMVGLQHQLAQHDQEVQGALGGIHMRLHEVIAADDGLMNRFDFVVIMLMALRGERIDTPRQACILPPWDFANPSGLSDDEQKPESWTQRLREWQDDGFEQGKGVFHTDKRLFLVCAQTHRLVPCGPSGHGYDLGHARKWVRVASNVAISLLEVACSTLGAILAIPLPGASAAAGEAASAGIKMLQGKLKQLCVDDGDAELDKRSQVWPIAPKTIGKYRKRLRSLVLTNVHSNIVIRMYTVVWHSCVNHPHVITWNGYFLCNK